MKSVFAYRNLFSTVLSVMISVTLVAVSVQAGSTISTNISTDGTLAVTGLSTLTDGYVSRASSTAVSTLNVSGSLRASSTSFLTGAIATYGNLTISNTATTTVTFSNSGSAVAGIAFDTDVFVIDPIANRVGIGTSTPLTAFVVAGTASTTDLVSGSLGIGSSTPWTKLGVVGTTTSTLGSQIGQNGNPVTQLLFGTCAVDIPEITISATAALTASTSAVANCSATGVSTSDRIWITPVFESVGVIHLMGASSTAANTIQVQVGLTATTSGKVDPPSATWNWMAIR